MLKRDDLSYFISSIYTQYYENMPLEERVKLAKQIAEIFLDIGNYEKAEDVILQIKNCKDFDQLQYTYKYIVLKTLYRIVYKKGEFKQAEKILIDILKLLRENQDDYRMCFTYIRLGNVYSGLKDYGKATEYYSKAIEIGEKIDEKKCLATAYNNIAVYYAAALKNYDEALPQFQKALSLYETLSKPDLVIMASILVNIGGVMKHKNLYDKALDHYQRAHSIAKKLFKYDLMAHIYKEKAEVYFLLGEYEISKVFAERALSVYETIDGYENRKWMAEIFVLLGKILHKQGASFEDIFKKFTEASKYYEVYGAPIDLINLYKTLSEIALEKGLKKQAKELIEIGVKIAEKNGLKNEKEKLEKDLTYL